MTNGLMPLPPIQYPTIVIGGQMLVVKFSLLAEYMLDLEGVEISKLPSMFSITGAGRLSLMMKLLTAFVAHNYVERGKQPPNIAEMVLAIDNERQIDPEIADKCLSAVTEALLKNVRPAAAKTATTPDQPTQ